jgi:protein tyrosine phosphatase type 4A
MASVANKPSLVERPSGLRFLIIDRPTSANLDAYLREFRAHKVCDLARACESDQCYKRELVEEIGVRVHDVAFEDGSPPPPAVIQAWLKVCAGAFGAGGKGNAEGRAVAVHCIAGLGRAPVLVAIALIEDGMEPIDAVDLIRRQRRGAINAKQLEYLQNSYTRQKKGACAVV